MTENHGHPDGDGRQADGRAVPAAARDTPFRKALPLLEDHLLAQPSPALVRAAGRRICRAVTLMADQIAHELAARVIDTDAPAERR